MTLIRGGPAGPDGLGGAYENGVETDRAALWNALGGRQGVLHGFEISGLAGQMALSLTAGAALVDERDAAGNAGTTLRGYLVWADTDTTVTFGAASASNRNDALVAAFVDTEDGPVGTGGLDVGPHLVVVPGTSGVLTPVTDADITTYLGRGGWLRLADVPVASTDTEINTANLDTHDGNYQPESAMYRKVTGTQTLTSASNVDVTDLSHTAHVTSSDVLMVDVSIDARHVSGGATAIFELLVDGVAEGGQIVGTQADNGNRLTLVKRWRVTGMSAGSHTVKVAGRLSAATGSWEALSQSTMVVERRRS